MHAAAAKSLQSSPTHDEYMINSVGKKYSEQLSFSIYQ